METPLLEQTYHVSLTDTDNELLETLQERFFENIEKYKLFNNKPDLIIWNSEVKTCQMVEFSCPVDINVSKKVSEKENIYVACSFYSQIINLSSFPSLQGDWVQYQPAYYRVFNALALQERNPVN